MYATYMQNKPLSEVSTFGIGGPARYFVEVKEVEHLQEVIAFCYREGLAYMVIGKGSNCLFSDAGFDGLVILNKIDFCKELDPLSLHVGAGFSFALLGMQTAKRGLCGLEFAAGIPATVGGAIYMNAGAQGAEIEKALTAVEYINEKGELQFLERASLQFAYRKSPFQSMKGAISAGYFRFTEDPSSRARQLELLAKRIESQPYHEKSAGCVFRNPSCASAGKLIDSCGLKGFAVGGAKVSEMHANFLINRGNASSADMLELIELVKRRVKEQHGVDLEPEIRIV